MKTALFTCVYMSLTDLSMYYKTDCGITVKQNVNKPFYYFVVLSKVVLCCHLNLTNKKHLRSTTLFLCCCRLWVSL